MDYCSTCRRHLNGALVCPGCGAYAPDIAPSVIGGHTVPGTATAATASEAGVRPPDPRPDGMGDMDDMDDIPEPAAMATVATGTGRAARRRQVIRWKKTQRRALVATAVALVGGGLTLASMDRGGGDRAQAAGAPDLGGMGGGKDLADQYDDLDDVPSASRSGRSGRPRTVTGEPPEPPRRPAPFGQPHGERGRRGHGGARPGVPATDGVPGPRLPRGSGYGQRVRVPGERRIRYGHPARVSAPATGDDGGGADQGQATPSAPATTAPDPQLCLLVICLG
ncbi:hypothetical protein SHKM778_01530 [Streptomyces sp. KM77-8]|uniref:Zinc ribbon domain-containing protein n=1 Tax=Streptomyces haneummycinicus TaxID=3074435 RepID=A0AAT9H8P5_9ACTN